MRLTPVAVRAEREQLKVELAKLEVEMAGYLKLSWVMVPKGWSSVQAQDASQFPLGLL